MEDKQSPGKESLYYKPSKVSWATAEFISRPPSWAAQAYLYLLIICLLTAVAYSHYTKVAISVKSRGLLQSKESIFPIQSKNSIQIKRLHVKTNQKVKKGQVLITSFDQIADKQRQIINADIKKVSELIRRDAKADCVSCVKELELLQSKLFQVEASNTLKSEFNGLHELIKSWILNKYQQDQIVIETADLRRKINLNRKKLSEIKRQNVQRYLASQSEALKSEIISAEGQIADRVNQIKNQLKQTQNKIEIKLSILPDLLQQNIEDNQITAPIDGIISKLKVSGDGQVIAPGQNLMEIIPSDSKLLAKLQIANKDISQIKKGMNVKLRLDAFPEREYGTLMGTVVNVPPDISDRDNPSGPSVYEVSVELEKQNLVKNGVEYAFRIGMTLDGLIITRRESLLSLGVKKLLNIKDELLVN